MPAATNWVAVGDLDVPGNQLTVEALIYYTGTSIDIVSKHTNPGDVNYLLRIGGFEITTTSGFAAFGGAAAAGVTLVPNRMYHLAATYDGAMLKYYVNGCLTGQMAWTGNMVQNNLTTAIGNMSTCQCEQFIGYIDEVRIWNVARTQAQIAANMTNLPTPTTQPGLLGYWKFDGDMINQQGNPAYDGVPVGAPQFQQVPLPYPTALFESVTSSNPVCAGDADGVINISASGYYTPYEYSLDGITYNSSPVFPGLNAGTYTVYTRPQNNNSCAVSSTVVLADPPVLNPNLTTTDVSCNGGSNGSASVAPSGGDGPTYHQTWQPSLSTSSSVSGLAAGSYSVNVTDTCKAAGPELVVNGQFEDGNTGFSTGYTCCAGGPGNYAVDADPNYYNSGHFGSGYGGGGNYLILDGSTVAGTSAWCQSIPVSPNTYYSFSAFVASNYSSVLAIVDFTINGSSIGTLSAPGSTFTWDPFSAVWYSGSSTIADICIYDQNTIAGGNDFGIDNISFKTCLSCTATVPFTITEPTAIGLSTVQTNVSCSGGNDGTATVTASGGTPGYSYSWNTVPVQNTAAATGLSAGTYTVTVTDANSCSSTASVTITSSSSLSLTLVQSIAPACNGASTGSIFTSASGGTAPYSFSWMPVVSTLDSAVNIPAGTYGITLTDANGCLQLLSVTISDPPLLSVTASASQPSICAGIISTLSATPAGGTGSYSYAWSNTSSAASQPVQPAATTTYSVTVTDNMGCTASDTVLVTVFIPADIDLGSDTSICMGDMITLDAGPGFSSYLWQNGSTTQTENVNTADMYFVFAADANGCLSHDTITVNVFPLPVIGLADTAGICPGMSTTLTASPGFASYAWSNGASSPFVTVSAPGNNVVTVTDVNGCSNSDSTFVLLYPVPTLAFSVSPLAGCPPLTVSTQNNSLLNGSSVTSWLWQIGPNSLPSFEPVTVLGSSGQYNVFLQATTSNGCVVDTLLSNYIEVYPSPDALIVPEANEYELFDDNMVIYNNSSSGIYTWSLNGNFLSNDDDIVYPITDAGDYVFQLLVTNSYGCMDSTDITVTVNPGFAIYFPNAFSPDQSTYNDVYAPKGFGIKEYELMIFDRWGNMIFRSTDLNTGWDGTVKGSGPYQDVYVYKCRVKDMSNNKHYYTGHITLIQ
jgi:gliding motility-associated-like protein